MLVTLRRPAVPRSASPLAIRPAPPPISRAEHAELAAARRRLRPKWAMLDRLLADYAATDAHLGRS